MSEDVMDALLHEHARQWAAESQPSAPQLPRLVASIPERRSGWLAVAASVVAVAAVAITLSFWSTGSHRSTPAAAGPSSFTGPRTQGTVTALSGRERTIALAQAHDYAQQTRPAGVADGGANGWPANVSSVSGLVADGATAVRYSGGGAVYGAGDFVVVRLIGKFDGSSLSRGPTSTGISGTSLTLVVALANDVVVGADLDHIHPAADLPNSTILFRR